MKLGLVLEGGASRTVYSCGVMDAFLEKNIIADYVIGTSAGISYAVSYCSLQKGRNLKITEKYMHDKRYMGVRHMFNKANKSYYNLDFVFDEIPNKLIPFDYKAYAGFKGNIIAVMTDIETGKVHYAELPRDEYNWLSLRATCAMPILFKDIEINGHIYSDGGVVDSVPFEKAIADGCDKVIVVLTRARGYVKQAEKVTGLVKSAYRKHPQFVNAFVNRPQNYNESIKRLNALEKEGKAYIIAPKDTHGIGRTEKRAGILVPYHIEGYKDTMAQMDNIKSFIEG